MFQKIFLFSVIAIFANCENTDNYILRPKNSVKSVRLNKNKIRGNAKIFNEQFMFVQNVTIAEMNTLSNDFFIEKDEKVSIKWHLDRIDQRFLPLTQTSYTVNSSDLIDMYIVDTGTNIDHVEFSENNRIFGGNFVDDGINTDCNGHGTHVASLAVGKQYGSGKRANLIAVKVLGCDGSGYYSNVIKAIEWITNRSKTSGKISIVNMSLGGPSSSSLDNAISASFQTGVYYVVAAGNSNANACNYSPARVPNAITVAASDINDYKASFSNHGPCVDVYAPGVNLVAAWLDNGYARLSGTSMASPVASGVLASYMSRYGKNGYSIFYQSMTSNVIIKNAKRTVNKLVYVI